MEIVVNRCWGGFGLSEKACKELGVESYYEVDRTNPKLIEMVKTWDPQDVNAWGSTLKVIELPFKTSDWVINDYDGMEIVYYVVDGKIYTA